jgi:hypothetical protein
MSTEPAVKIVHRVMANNWRDLDTFAKSQPESLSKPIFSLSIFFYLIPDFRKAVR